MMATKGRCYPVEPWVRTGIPRSRMIRTQSCHLAFEAGVYKANICACLNSLNAQEESHYSKINADGEAYLQDIRCHSSSVERAC